MAPIALTVVRHAMDWNVEMMDVAAAAVAAATVKSVNRANASASSQRMNKSRYVSTAKDTALTAPHIRHSHGSDDNSPYYLSGDNCFDNDSTSCH